MADLSFNTPAGQTIERELLIAYLNTGSSSSPTWSPCGKRVEDSSMEIDWGEETKQDILGDIHSTMKKPVITQSFEPCELDSDDAGIVKIWNMAIKDHDYQALANMDMLIVHFYADSGTTGANPFAERYQSCMVKPSSLGGAGGGSVGMPFDVTYGGTRTTGTASKSSSTGAITFTPDTGSGNGGSSEG